MEKIRLAIIDQDFAYAEALGQYLSFESEDFEVYVADITILEREKPEEFHLALISNVRMDENNNYHIRSKWRILLSEDKVTDVGFIDEQNINNKTPDRIYKYLPAPEIAKELRYIYALLSGKGKLIRRDKKTWLIGIISGASRSGKTVIAITLARLLSKFNGKKVLYICMDNFDCSLAFFREAHKSNRTISDFLYYVFKGSEKKQIIPPESFMFRDFHGVFAFYPGMGINELNTLCVEELELFIQYIYENGNFDYIIIDFNNDLHSGSQYLLQQCKEIFLVHSLDLVSKIQTVSFTRYFEHLIGELKIIKYKNLYNFATIIPEDDHENFYIEADSNSFFEAENIMEVSISSAFGSGVGLVKDYIIER